MGDDDGLLGRAHALCELRRFDEAVGILARVIAAEPQNADAWCLLARAEVGRGNDTQALQAAQKAAAYDPEAEWPHRLASIALGHLGQHGEAVVAARESARLAPHNWSSLTTLADALIRIDGGAPEARAVVERAVRLAPLESHVHMVRGRVLAAAGKRDEAEDAFARSLSLDPQNSAAHNERARTQLRHANITRPGALADTATGFATALRSDPTAAVSRRNLDLVCRVFIARVSYLLFLAAYLARGAASARNPAERLLPLALCGVPAFFAWRFLRRLRPELRRYVISHLRGRQLRIPVALDLLAVALFAVTVVEPRHARTTTAAIAAVLAFAARLMLLQKVSMSSRAATGAAPAPLYSTTLVTVAAVCCGLFTLAMLWMTMRPAGTSRLGIATLFGAALTGWLVYVIRRRKVAHRRLVAQAGITSTYTERSGGER